jgi:bifunctional NMN adenylyltransferase/nudix hydrolase
VIWAVENQWPSALPTVDIAILDRNAARVLLCRKPNQKLLRFVGGFASPDSESYEDDAKRETLEETHLECDNFQYIGSARVRDWRFEGERNKIKTSFFACDYTYGTPVADDDIAEVEWVSFKALKEDMLIEEHKALFRMLKAKVIDKI